MMISNKHKNILENLFKENYEQDLWNKINY
jgi:hypothetical protein